MSLKNSKMTKSTKEKHGVKKTLRTAVILCAAVAAGISAGSSGNIAKANNTDHEDFLFTHGWEGIDFDTSLCYPKDNESNMLVYCDDTNYPLCISAIGSNSVNRNGDDWTLCSNYSWRHVMNSGDVYSILNTVKQNGFDNAGLLGESYEEDYTRFVVTFRTDAED